MLEAMVTCDQGFIMKSESGQRSAEEGRGLTNHRPLLTAAPVSAL